MKSKAFTMAEVLITIGIIGIVAAMTLPQLVMKYKKIVVENRLKKVYSTLSQALNRSQAEHGDIEQWEWEQVHGKYMVETQAMKVFASKYFIPYFAKLRKEEYTTLTDFGYADPTFGTNSSYKSSKHQVLVLADGTILIFDLDVADRIENNPNPVNGLNIYVDTNGMNTPNVMGSDVFTFHISTKTGKFMPDENYSRDELIEKCRSYEDRGYSCTKLILYDGWKIKADYPIKTQ